MGRLYEAEHARLPRRLVIKVIHETFSDNPDAVARFEREARAVARIVSDHVVTVVDVVRTPDDRPAIVSERLDGEDLYDRCERLGRLAIPAAVRIARELGLGLAAVHAAGVLHRDLKPSNVFLHIGPEGIERAKLLDFGVAKLEDGNAITQSGALVGTPAYMAPEQADGTEPVDHRSDIYGLAAVLFRMLTGQAPYGTTDATESLERMKHRDPVPLRRIRPSVPSGLAAIVDRALSRFPDERPQSAIAFAEALQPFEFVDDDLPTTLHTSVPPVRDGGSKTLVVPKDSFDSEPTAGLGPVRAKVLTSGVIATAGSALAVAAAVSEVADGPRVVRALSCLAALLVGSGLIAVARRRWYGPRRLERLAWRLRRAAAYAFAATGASIVTQLGWSALSEQPVAYGSWTLGLAVAAALWGGLVTPAKEPSRRSEPVPRLGLGGATTLPEAPAPVQLSA